MGYQHVTKRIILSTTGRRLMKDMSMHVGIGEAFGAPNVAALSIYGSSSVVRPIYRVIRWFQTACMLVINKS